MDETPHLVAHFMAAGAEKRLEDYCFLRNTYEKISGQEIQLNRILRMLGEDEISLNWRIDLSTVGRARARSAQDFDRWANSLVLKGSIAYERLRDLEQDNSSKRATTPTIPSSSRRVQELRERRQRLSEQRDYPSGSMGRSSPARSQALAEYDAAISDWAAKRRQQVDENRSRISKTEDRQITERKFDRYKPIPEDPNDSYKKFKSIEEDTSNNRTRKSSYSNEDLKRKQEKNIDNEPKSPPIQRSRQEKPTDIELIAFTVRCQPVSSSNKTTNEQDTSVRLQCKWASPSSSSQIEYFTIEQQLDSSGEWLPIGDQIDKQENKTQLDIQASNNDENKNVPSYFRLKAHLQDGQTFTSKSTDGILLNLFQAKNIIVPDVEVLSPSSVQLTWQDTNENTTQISENDNENEKQNENDSQNTQSTSNIYDIEKKEEQQDDWEKVLEVPLAQRSARIDSLTDAAQCQFRLVPTNADSSEETKQSAGKSSTKDSEEMKQPVSKSSTKDSEEMKQPVDKLSTKDSEEVEQSTDKSSTKDSEEVEQSTGKSPTKDSEETKQSISPENDLETTNVDDVEQPKTTSSDNELKLQETDGESDVLTVSNVNEWLSSLQVTPTSPTTVNINISDEGFNNFDAYTVEYATADKPNQWKQMSNITQDDPHQTIDKLKQGTEYKFRFTPVLSDTANETNSSQLSLILDVQMPAARRGRFDKDESETPVSTPPQFSVQKIDSTTVLIEATIPDEQPATFEDIYDVYSKKDTENDEDWTKVGTIDKEHLSTKVENLEENTAYDFKIDNITSPSTDDNQNTTVQQLKFDTTPVKQFDSSLLLEKIEQSLENVVNGVMQAAAGHQTIDEPINESLNEVIKEVFHDKNLVPNQEYGFDTLALNDDLQLYRGPKQMMLQELEVNETSDLSKYEGEIIIHNYRTAQQSVLVREENGNTHVAHIDGDIIIRNVVSDVILKNDRTHHQLSMNIVGQAFLKGVQGSLIASKFKGIIVVKNVHKP